NSNQKNTKAMESQNHNKLNRRCGAKLTDHRLRADFKSAATRAYCRRHCSFWVKSLIYLSRTHPSRCTTLGRPVRVSFAPKQGILGYFAPLQCVASPGDLKNLAETTGTGNARFALNHRKIGVSVDESKPKTL